jgi:hypothetical protein
MDALILERKNEAHWSNLWLIFRGLVTGVILQLRNECAFDVA